MVEPTSDLEEDVDPDDAPTCEVCGGTIVASPTHQVRTWVEDGQVQHRHFCGESCLAEWRFDPA